MVRKASAVASMGWHMSWMLNRMLIWGILSPRGGLKLFVTFLRLVLNSTRCPVGMGGGQDPGLPSRPVTSLVFAISQDMCPRSALKRDPYPQGVVNIPTCHLSQV